MHAPHTHTRTLRTSTPPAPNQNTQTVQYIQPQHHARLAQAELLVIDEAAAIPLPVVRAMLGPYLVFLCSTVNGCAPGAWALTLCAWLVRVGLGPLFAEGANFLGPCLVFLCSTVTGCAPDGQGCQGLGLCRFCQGPSTGMGRSRLGPCPPPP